MLVRLDFYLHYGPKHHPIDEKFILDDMRKDIVLETNNDNKLKLQIWSGNYFNDGVDVTDWKFYLTIKQNPTDTDDEAIYKNDNADMEDAVDGKVDILIALASGQDFLGNYLYEIKAKTKTGKIRTMCFGILTYQLGLSSRIT